MQVRSAAVALAAFAGLFGCARPAAMTPAAPGIALDDANPQALAKALYAALDRGDAAAALACFEDDPRIIVVGLDADDVAIGHQALAARASSVLPLGEPIGAITRERAPAGKGGVFLDDVARDAAPPMRVQMFLVPDDHGHWRVRMFHAGLTLPDDEAGRVGEAGGFPLSGWPHFPEHAAAPEGVLAVNRAWQEALAARDLDRFMDLMANPLVLGAGSAPLERATDWQTYRGQIAPLLAGKPARPPIYGRTLGFEDEAGAWSLNAYELGDGKVPVRATLAMDRLPGGLFRIRAFFASVPRPARAAPGSPVTSRSGGSCCAAPTTAPRSSGWCRRR